MKMKKTFACLLAVLLICGIMPTGVFADETSDGETTDEPRYKVAIQLTDSEKRISRTVIRITALRALCTTFTRM